jgi:hypothetical protein
MSTDAQEIFAHMGESLTQSPGDRKLTHRKPDLTYYDRHAGEEARIPFDIAREEEDS